MWHVLHVVSICAWSSRMSMLILATQVQTEGLGLLVPYALHPRHQLRHREAFRRAEKMACGPDNIRPRSTVWHLRPMDICRPPGTLENAVLSPCVQVSSEE